MRFNNTLQTLVRQTLESGSTPALMGEPGIGKSSFVEDLAYSMGTKQFTVAVNQLADKADLTGARLVPTADGSSYHQVFYPHQVIQEAAAYAEANPREFPILFLDEINRTTADVTSGVLTLVTLRRIGNLVLPKNLRIVVAGNDKGNVTALDEASLSRFVIFHVEPDASTLISVLDNVNPWVKEVLTQHPTLVFQKSTPNAILADGSDDDDDQTMSMADIWDGGEEMSQLTTPRTIDNLSRWLNKADTADLASYLATTTQIAGRDSTVLEEIIESFVGQTAFTTQLLGVMARVLASSATATTHQTNVPRPSCYADLQAATSITDLENQIAQLSDKERSGSLLFALKEPKDNRRLIEQLCLGITSIDQDHTRTLIELARNDELDAQNKDALMNSNATSIEGMKLILSSYV